MGDTIYICRGARPAQYVVKFLNKEFPAKVDLKAEDDYGERSRPISLWS